MVDPETIRTPIVGSFQKRALRGCFGHNAFPTRRTAGSSALCDAPREVWIYQTKKGNLTQRHRGAKNKNRNEFFYSLRLCASA
jgi:hypothetical protein